MQNEAVHDDAASIGCEWQRREPDEGRWDHVARQTLRRVCAQSRQEGSGLISRIIRMRLWLAPFTGNKGVGRQRRRQDRAFDEDYVDRVVDRLRPRRADPVTAVCAELSERCQIRLAVRFRQFRQDGLQIVAGVEVRRSPTIGNQTRIWHAPRPAERTGALPIKSKHESSILFQLAPVQVRRGGERVSRPAGFAEHNVVSIACELVLRATGFKSDVDTGEARHFRGQPCKEVWCDQQFALQHNALLDIAADARWVGA